MAVMPSDTLPESTLALGLDPYRYISRRCRELGSNVFQARILLQKTICMVGKEAAQLFYDETLFMRTGAAPLRMQKTLLGVGGVQALDDNQHLHRKRMFLACLNPETAPALGAVFQRHLEVAAQQWEHRDQVKLSLEIRPVLCQAVCEWASVPLRPEELYQRTYELSAMFDAAGSVGPRHWSARLARGRAERWIEGIIEDVRAGRLDPPEHSAAYIVAWHKDLKGNLLDSRTAAVELINVLRPTVAISVFITFAAHALALHRDSRDRIAGGVREHLHHFVQEVRRFYPFFPAAVARVRRTFQWQGYVFPAGARALLDLYGTNHDPRHGTSQILSNPIDSVSGIAAPSTLFPKGAANIRFSTAARVSGLRSRSPSGPQSSWPVVCSTKCPSRI